MAKESKPLITQNPPTSDSGVPISNSQRPTAENPVADPHSTLTMPIYTAEMPPAVAFLSQLSLEISTLFGASEFSADVPRVVEADGILDEIRALITERFRNIETPVPAAENAFLPEIDKLQHFRHSIEVILEGPVPELDRFYRAVRLRMVEQEAMKAVTTSSSIDHPEGLCDQIIESVEDSRMVIYDHQLKAHIPLRYATALQFLRYAHLRGWNEPFELVDYSMRGMYFIRTRKHSDHPDSITLMASAGILKIGDERHLFRDPKFRDSSIWKVSKGRSELKPDLEAFFEQNNEDPSRKKYNLIPELSEDPTLAEVEEGLIALLGPQRVCELFRLAFDPSADFAFYTETLKILARELKNLGFNYVYAVVERLIIVAFKRIERNTDSDLRLLLPIVQAEDETGKQILKVLFDNASVANLA